MLQAIERNVDLGDGIGRQHDESRTLRQLSEALFRLEHRQRAPQVPGVEEG